MRQFCWRSTTIFNGSRVNAFIARGPRTTQQQCFSTLDLSKPHHAEVQVGSSGTIILDILNPPRPTQANPVIFYLPRGPFAQETSPEPHNLSSLGFDANAVVVRVNYRFSAKHRFPTPVHDVSAAYDWVLTHLLPRSTTYNGWSDSTSTVGFGVCGELLGGSLAAMLALTECHAGKTGIRAAAFGNPITDWTAMHVVHNNKIADSPSSAQPLPTVSTKRAPRKVATPDSWTAFSTNSALSSSSLLRARHNLFAMPEHYFDPFASPLLFFRTASSDMPPDLASEDPIVDDDSLLEFIRKRRAHRRHPPTGSGLLLPKIRVQLGKENLLKDQGIELAMSVIRSFEVSSRDSGGDLMSGRNSAREEKMVEVVESGGLGLWTEDDLANIGIWFGNALRSS